MNCDFLRGQLFAFQNMLALAQIKQLNDQIAARNADPTGYPPGSGYWTADQVNAAIAIAQAAMPPNLAAVGAYQAVLSDITQILNIQQMIGNTQEIYDSMGCGTP